MQWVNQAQAQFELAIWPEAISYPSIPTSNGSSSHQKNCHVMGISAMFTIEKLEISQLTHVSTQLVHPLFS
jgi:hypothetical protein